MRMMFERLAKDTRGQDLIEYALLGSVIALGVLGAMIYVKDKISSEFSSIGNTLTAGS
jgi:Flp pilus assembly pilin Flp